MMNNMYYEQRFIKNSKDNTGFQLFEDENRDTLSDILSENKKIVLLGNPGIGKSTELMLLFDNLWETREENLNFPININLKNFRTVSTFEDLIQFKKWKELPAITFILDGLDEIAIIQDFISDLENFLKINEDRKMTVVISCRTNIYEKYLIKISGFKYFYLDGLSDKQINNILEKRISKQLNYGELNKFRVYLENPFNLNLFCEYYEEKKSYPETQLESWDLFIENELKKLSKEKLIKREEIDIPHVKICLEKVAFTNELMQQNYIADTDLYNLLGKDDKSILEQISFIDKLPDSENYMFRHKNYQEFFSAKYLSELTVSDIIALIKINSEINKTKPSLFNTISFLLNIIDETKFNDITKWLLENEPEILFLTEKEKLNSEIQKEVFKNYFNDIAVEKTFWLGNDKRFSIDKMAEFADIDFLISVIKEDKHFRSVVSALNILALTGYTSKDSQIKELLIEIIFSEGNYVEEGLIAFHSKGFHRNDITSFLDIAQHFKNNYSAGIHHEIISMLADFDKIDDYFQILKNSLYKLYEIKPERIKDNVSRGTRWILEKIFLNIQNSENFLNILNIIFNNKFDIKLSDFYDKKFRKELINNALFFVKNDNDFLFRVIDAFLRPKDNLIYKKDDFLIELINMSSKNVSAFKYIINKYGLPGRNYLIICLFENKECIDYLFKKFQEGKLPIDNKNDITYLRNIYFNTNSELGYYYENIFKEAGYIFSEPLPTSEEFESNRKKKLDFIQQNFEILFDRQKLIQEVVKVFDENKVDTMTWHKIHVIEMEWCKKEDYHGIQNTVFKVISDSVRDVNSTTKEEVITKIQDDYFIFLQIKDKIKDRENKGFVVESDHIEYIREHCLKFSKEFHFEKVKNVKEDENIGLYNNYVLEMLYFFDEKYSITYPKDFYIKTLKYCNIFGNADENVEFIKNRINDITIFNQQIVQNLNNEILDISSLKDHIGYAIENKLKDSFQKIGEYILNHRYIYSQKDFLLRYTDLLSKHDQIIFLKKCCKDINSYLCWKAVDIFIDKNLDKDFILKIAKKYILSNEDEFISDALNVLFYCNDESTLNIYLDQLKKLKQVEGINLRDDYKLRNINSFKLLNNLESLKDIFEIIYDENLKNPFNFYNARNNFQSLIVNLSRTETGFREIQKILRHLKSKISNKESKFFYINNFINDSQLSYYNSLSKPFTFEEAKDYINKIENQTSPNMVIMGDQFNFNGGNFKGSQFGNNNAMNNYYTKPYSNNKDVKRIEELINEFKQMEIENEEWKNIFIEGLKDLLDLKESENEEKIIESKSKLKKLYDFVYNLGKKTNDWKNIITLPIEFHDKLPKLIELGEHLSKLMKP